MYRFYFKIINNDGSINSIHNVISNNSSMAYNNIKNKFNGLKVKLINRIDINTYLKKNW